MHSDIKASGQTDDPWTVGALVELCRETVGARPQSAPEVTVAAVAFYVLEWVSRLGMNVTRADALLVDSQGEAISRASVLQQIEKVIRYLSDWSGTVAALQNGDNKHWEIVRY